MTIARRSFLQTTAASLLLPSWLFRRAEKVRHIDLSLFCDEYCGPARFDMSRPFFQSQQTYATDGRICVRTGLLTEPPADSEPRRLPKADQLPYWSQDGGGWRSLRDAGRVKHVDSGLDCPACYGKGRLGAGVMQHAKCDGSGWFVVLDDPDDFNSYEKPCECGSGYVGGDACGLCAGSGRVDFAMVLPGGVRIAPVYQAKLLTLGEVEYRIPEHECPPVMLRFDGGEGLLMPIRF